MKCPECETEQYSRMFCETCGIDLDPFRDPVDLQKLLFMTDANTYE